MVLENVTALSLTNGEGLTLDFQEGVLPLLSACGEKLQNLILANFTEVDIAGELGQVMEIRTPVVYLRRSHISPSAGSVNTPGRARPRRVSRTRSRITYSKVKCE